MSGMEYVLIKTLGLYDNKSNITLENGKVGQYLIGQY